VRELKGFSKVLLSPGETGTVSFDVPSRELGYFDAKGRWLVEPGAYQVWIAQDSASGEPAAFELQR